MSEVAVPFHVEAVHHPGSMVLHLHGELDIATAPALRRALTGVMALPAEAVVIDLDALEFADLVGLRALGDAGRACAGMDASFCLRRVHPRIRRAIRLASMVELDGAIESPDLASPEHLKGGHLGAGQLALEHLSTDGPPPEAHLG